jgi:hypothetical protein
MPACGFDAVDGSSTGTSVPWMWALLGHQSDAIDRSESQPAEFAVMHHAM